MANPSWITSENVKFNGALDNAAVLDTTADVRSLILWDDLSVGDKQILTDFVNDNGGALPLAGPTAGAQVVNFSKTKKGADATGLSNVAAATAAVATIDIGGDKIAADASGLSSAQGTKGLQVVNFNNTIVAGSLTNLVPTSGYQAAAFTVAKVGGDATGLAVDAAGYQVVNVGGAITGDSATGLADDVPATSGYQVVNVGGAKVGGDPTGLTNDATVYTASISVDGVAKPIAVTGNAAQTFTTLLAEINTDLGASAVAALDAGNIKITSATTGIASTIAITDTDLFLTLTGYVAVNAAVAGVDTIVTTYTASISVDAGAHIRAVSITGGAAQTYTTLLAELISDSGSWYTATIEAGNINITSLQPGATSDIVITDTDLFSTLTGYVAINAGVVGTHPVYTATITVDGVAKPISIDGSNAQTFTTLINELNTDLGASAVAAVVGGGIKVTSATTTPTSTVLIAPGTLFAALTNFSAITAAVAGTGSTTALTATIVVDGVTKNISVLPAVIATFGDVINEINTDLGASAVASISGGDIKVVSATFGLYSTIHITDGTLFAALPSFAYVLPAQNGGGASRTYSATVVVDGKHVRPITFTGLAGDTIQHVLDEINTDLHLAAAAGYQDVKFGVNRVATSATGLANAATAYTATITLNGGARSISVLGNAAQTFADLVTEIQTDLDVGGVIGVVSIVNGKLRIASTTVSSASTVSIVDTGIHPLFGSLSFFLEVAPAVVGNDLVTYATAAVTAIPGDIKITSASTGVHSAVDVYDNGFLFNSLTDYAGISTAKGVAPTIYTATAVVDGVSKPIAVQGSAAQTFTTLINEINTDLGASSTAALTTPVAGYQDVLFSAVKAGGSATGLAINIPNYAANIVVDGFDVALLIDGGVAQTYTDLLTAINTDLGVDATATINADGGLRITSAATGIVSSVVIEDDVTTPLFATLTDYVGIATNQIGIGSDISITSATTGVASKVSINDGTLFNSIGAKGIAPAVNGIVSMLDAAKIQKLSGSKPIFDHFDVIRVGITPSSLWSAGHVPAKASIPKVPQFTYFDGTVWKFLADDTEVNP